MRIVTHSCSNTEIVCALGRADWLVGVDDHSDYPAPVVERLVRVGPDLDLDIGRVAALKPDLVIASLTVPGHERVVEKLRAAGLPHLITQPRSLGDVAADIRRIGALLEAEPAARALASQFETRITQPRPGPGSVPILIEWWPKPVIVPGARSWVNEMLRLAGARNPFDSEDVESLKIDDAQAVAAAPEAIVMSWCGVEESKYRPHVVRRRAGWKAVPAIEHDRIFAISEAWLGRPGPRLLQGIDNLRSVVAQCTGAVTRRAGYPRRP